MINSISSTIAGPVSTSIRSSDVTNQIKTLEAQKQQLQSQQTQIEQNETIQEEEREKQIEQLKKQISEIEEQIQALQNQKSEASSSKSVSKIQQDNVLISREAYSLFQDSKKETENEQNKSTFSSINKL